MLCGVSANTLNSIENGIEGMKVSSVLKITMSGQEVASIWVDKIEETYN